MQGKQLRGCEWRRALAGRLPNPNQMAERRLQCVPFVQVLLVKPKWLLENEYLDAGRKTNDNPRVTCREADVCLWVLAQAF